MDRLKRSATNATVGLLGQIFSITCNFASRMVFVRTLSQDYLGIEGLFSSLLVMLSLAELGIGSAIIYSLYEPLAKDDREKIRSLMQLYRRAYWTIAAIVAALGIFFSLKLEWFIKEIPDIKHLRLYFLLFVANTAVSYLYSYKGTLIGADQKQYVVDLWRYLFTLIMTGAQVIILLTTGSYFGFLICMVVCTFLQNFVVSIVTDRRYPFLKSNKPIQKIDSETLAKIKKNTFALVLHKIGGIASAPATNVILSIFVGLHTVAVYSNYLLVSNALQHLVARVFNATVASIGNLGVEETREKQIRVFNLTFYVNACLATLISIPLLAVFSNAMHVFFGKQYVFPAAIELAIVCLFYLIVLRTATITFTSAYGLYWYTRWKPIIETIVLLGLSIITVQMFGIIGILFSNCFTLFFISASIEAYMLYKHGFKISPRQYYMKFTGYSVGTIAGALLIQFILAPISASSLTSLLLRGVTSLSLSIILFFGATCWTPEFKEFWKMLKDIRAMLRRKAQK